MPESMEIKSPDDFARVFPVSRETVDRLKTYESELIRWQRAVNLVAPNTLPDIWHRHFADSLQIEPFIPKTAEKLADLGSGAGFPGLVLAAHFHVAGSPRITLVEADQRKAAFLREVARAMQISVDILSTRIESNANLAALSNVDVFVARALAPLDRLLDLVAPYLLRDTVCLFLKGREFAREIADARTGWQFDLTEHASLTDTQARILELRAVEAK